jgi:hypothetical protein
MELYTAGSWRWAYICLYCLAVIPVLYTVSLSPLESLLALGSLLGSLLRSLLDSLHEGLLDSLHHSVLESLLERATLESCA